MPRESPGWTCWEVVGGADKGGIVVREGKALGSQEASERLSTAAVVEEVDLVGDRLRYRLVEGTGPETGWVSVTLKGRSLVARIAEEEEAEDAGGPGDEAEEVVADRELAERVAAEAAEAAQEGGSNRLQLYLPRYGALGAPLAGPRLRVLCFHHEGGSESLYTGRGPLAAWAAEGRDAVEVCAPNYPGRCALLDAARHKSAEALAGDLLRVLHGMVGDGVPYLVWAHSAGTWVAFEFLILCRKLGLPMPRASFLMAFPAPHMPATQRRWRRSSRLHPGRLQDEVMQWDPAHFKGPGSVIFEADVWRNSFEPLFRADFKLFDEYKFKHRRAPKFAFPIHAWHFADDHYVEHDMVKLWGDWTAGQFETRVLGMGHLTCLHRADEREVYFQRVVDLMKGYAAAGRAEEE